MIEQQKYIRKYKYRGNHLRRGKHGPEPEDIIKKFFRCTYPEPNTGCWLWLGNYSKEGYGRLVAKRTLGFGSAHRLSYFIHNGDFDRSKIVMHKCDVPTCVNPDHLILGTNDENMADMVAKKRAAIGEKNVKAKLTSEQVLQIRQLSKTLSRKEISNLFGISKTQTAYIITGKGWKHLPL